MTAQRPRLGTGSGASLVARAVAQTVRLVSVSMANCITARCSTPWSSHCHRLSVVQSSTRRQSLFELHSGFVAFNRRPAPHGPVHRARSFLRPAVHASAVTSPTPSVLRAAPGGPQFPAGSAPQQVFQFGDPAERLPQLAFGRSRSPDRPLRMRQTRSWERSVFRGRPRFGVSR